MKKLFTLFALLAMVLSASAKEVIDSEIDFTKVSEYKDYLWNNAEAAARITIQDGCLHFESTEKTGVNWDCQFSPLPGVQGMEEELVYKVTIKIKGSPNARIAAHLGGTVNYGAIEITEDWSVQEIEYPCTNPKGDYNSNHLFTIQCGDFVGYYDIEYIKITHDEQESATPTEWKENLVNGDAEGEFGEIACVQSKIFNTDEEKRQEIFPSEIIDEGGNKVFVTHSKAVVPALLWEEDGEQWGTKHSAGDPKPDNAWQNQMWITFPRAMKDGEVYTLKFKYKASKAVKVSTQTHNLPGSYLGGGPVGDLSFTTSWQTFEKKITAAGEQSIAFNLGQEIYDEDIDFYLDDISMQTMVLEEGYFVAGINNGDALAKYDYQNAIKFEYDEDEEAHKAVIGTKGDETSWVNEVMISTVRGDDKQFQVNTIKLAMGKPQNDPEAWVAYGPSSKAKLQLPAAGVWQIMISEEDGQINFVKLEGEEDKVPEEIKPNPTEVVVNAVERDWKPAKTGEGVEPNTPQDGEEGIGTGQAWDNQFMIMAKRPLKSGEVTIVKFKYSSEIPAKVTTQCGGDTPGAYVFWNCIGDVNFTTEEQEFEKEYTIPKDQEKEITTQSITFNMAEMKGANKYTIKDISWEVKDEGESLIDMVGTSSFFVKEGAGTTPYEFGTENPNAINNVTVKATSNATYNLAGQRVSKEYKGIAIKNGVKFIVK